MGVRLGLGLLALTSVAAFTNPSVLPTHHLLQPATHSGAFAVGRSYVAASGRASVSPALRMKADPEPAQVVKAGSSGEADVEKQIVNGGFWSCPPSTATMYTSNPEYFKLLKGRVTITAVTIQGRELGEEVEFAEGDLGMVPAGSYRWRMIKPTTKQTSCREGLQLATKGWREEPPLTAMRGIGTLSTIGRTSEDDLAHLKELIADKGLIPETAFENAIQYKLGRDVYLTNLEYAITDRGLLIMDRVTDEVLTVLTGEGFKDYNPDLEYVETERSVRYNTDGSFERNPMTGK